MLKTVVAALALAAGVPVTLVGVVWLLASAPVLGLVTAGAWAIVTRRQSAVAKPGPDDEAAFLHGVASEMAGGAAPRAALVAAASRAARLDLSQAVRLAEAGMPAERVAPSLERALPLNGRLAAGAWLLAARSGGPATGMFHSLALRSAEEGELRRERRALTSQARASAWVVAGLPVALLAVMGATGRLAFDDPALVGIIAAGLALQAAGIAVVVLMLRGAR